jgi:hypothetical protein
MTLARLYKLVRILVAFLVGWTLFAQDKVNPDALIVQDFNKRVTDYMNIQKGAAKELPVLKSTPDPKVILERQEKLAHKIREARRHVGQGAVFTPEISKEFRRLLGFAREGDNDKQIKKSLERAEPVRLTLHVNDAYPSDIPLQSTPPTILMNLPALPKGLEYRIASHALVLRDATANIVVDLIPNAVP